LRDSDRVPIGGDVFKRKELARKCRRYPGGLYYFAKNICGFTRLNPRIHLPFCNYIQLTVQPEGPRMRHRPVSWMPREHFKSVIVSVAYPLWLLACVDRNLTIALISAHSDNTKKWLGQIRRIIESNGLFQFAFPAIRQGDKWAESELMVTRDQNLSGEAQASITAYSLNSGLASQHHHVIILDDPVNEQTAASDQEMTNAVEKYIHLEEILRGWRNSTFIVNGTPWGREDVLHEAQKEERRGFRVKWGLGVLGDFVISDELRDYPELIPEVTPGKPILPEECDEEKLDHIRQQDREKYYFQYLCKPYDEGRNGFDLELIRDFAELPDGKLLCQCHPMHDHHLRFGLTLAVSDPAYTKGKEGCETSILVGNRQPCGCRFLLHEFGEHIHPSEYIERACYMAGKFKTWLRGWGVESEALQLTLKQWLEEKQRTGEFPLDIEIFPLESRNRSKDARISGAQNPVNNGLWHKPPTMKLVEGQNNTLLQLFHWPYSRQRDRADAFAYFEDAFAERPVSGRSDIPDTLAHENSLREQLDMDLFLSEAMAE